MTLQGDELPASHTRAEATVCSGGCPARGVRAAPRYPGSMSLPRALTALGDERFISLTTFLRSGNAVSTPVWIARDGDVLAVTTPAMSGEVKRLRNSPASKCVAAIAWAGCRRALRSFSAVPRSNPVMT